MIHVTCSKDSVGEIYTNDNLTTFSLLNLLNDYMSRKGDTECHIRLEFDIEYGMNLTKLREMIR